ncbi:hypothetical protein RD110_18520 [Rhodoferax koreense]|uniref:Uncharacterized protein n=1 Tax=Rhodoferax koreensis TaxID=1842727 RepID=A0A1P8JZ29_9BURK|nr:hypothetical protein [Rhodoferax koreense]APW38951.1 hypothetical protein RD110_18520 [Rhodoferax koreense]
MSEHFFRQQGERGPRHCQWCEHWGGPTNPRYPDGSIWCVQSRLVKSTPRDGCAYWARATGLDRDDIPPSVPYVDHFALEMAAMKEAMLREDADIQAMAGDWNPNAKKPSTP